MFRTPTMIDEAFWTARARSAALRAERRAALGLGEADFVALAVSKLTRGKRVSDLISAFARLGPGATLLIAGHGEERARLEAQAADARVDARFLGFVNIDALPALYAAADVFAHAGEKEQYGMVALEAAILGLPLVLSDETGALGPTSIARPGVNAAAFACGDVGALAAALCAVRDDPELRRRMAAASLAISEDHRGPQSIAAVLAAAG